MAKGKVKLSMTVDVKTADEIDKIAKDWEMSLSGTLRYMTQHYLTFGVKSKPQISSNKQ